MKVQNLPEFPMLEHGPCEYKGKSIMQTGALIIDDSKL